MDCPNCGDTLREGARYCSKCGARVHRYRTTEELAPPRSQAQISTYPMPSVHPPEERLENARVGYEAAVSLWNERVRLAWFRFTVMTVANSVILVTIGWTINLNPSFQSSFARALSLVGIVACLAWLHAHSRASQYNNYLMLSVRELEGHLADPVVTVSRGASFFEGNEVTFVIDNEEKRLRLSWLARENLFAGTESFCYLIIASFLLLYIFFLLWPSRLPA